VKSRKGSIVLLVAGLLISFPALGPTQTAGLTLDRYVSEPSDDAVEIVPSGLVTTVSQTIEMNYLGGANQLVAIRFSSVPIPKGASILRAYIQLHAAGECTGPASFLVRGQAADNALTFTASKHDISGRPNTTASITWSPADWQYRTLTDMAGNTDQMTPELRTIVQEIVSRSGWQQGNAIVITLQGSGTGSRKIYSTEGTQRTCYKTLGPKLHIVYSTGSGQAIPRVSKYEIYYGTLHNHTAVSDGNGSNADAFAYARDIGGLDFLGITDHDSDLDSAKYDDLKNTADQFNSDGRFVTFYGFEWSTDSHLAVLNSNSLASSTDPRHGTLGKFAAWLSLQPDSIAFFNHPGSWPLCNFDGFNFGPKTDRIVGMELFNTEEDFGRFYYNDGYYPNDGGLSWFDEAIQRGWKIGAAGSSDAHIRDWGTAQDFRLAVLATARTRRAILEALKSRRFYSTLDKDLRLSFELNGEPMGATTSPGTYKAVIIAADGGLETFTEGKLIKNGLVIQTWSSRSSNPVLAQRVTGKAGDYFYALVRQEDGDEAISSPIYVTKPDSSR
jgi:hypothetical protein